MPILIKIQYCTFVIISISSYMSPSFTIKASQSYLIGFLAARSTYLSTPSQAASSPLSQSWPVNNPR